MTAVWQSLIPETPSTEPIASPLDGMIPPSPSESPHHHACNSNSGVVGGGHGGGVANSGGVSTICRGESDSMHHRHVHHSEHMNHNNNNNNHPSHHHHHLLKTNSRTSTATTNTGKTGTGFSRFTSVPCGEQLWRFYSGRLQSRRKHENRRRVLLKNGLRNLCQINVEEKPQRYWSDMFTTLVDARWRYTLFIFSLSYVLSWLGFALIWWIILVAHKDLENFGKKDWTPCVEGVKNFASIFLFSLETQHTIGYGYHRMTPECPDAIVVLCLQSIAGVLIEALMVGVVFAKLSRPKKRSETLIFSRNAVICLRDGQLYLMFRVGDIRKSHILEAHVRAQLVTKRTTLEGEVIPIHQEEIKVGGYGEDEDRILLFWPTTIVHPIDSESPLYEMSASDLLKAKLEVMVIMEGVVESTGMTTQARTSYLPSEILWGHRFRNTTCYKSESGHHLVDFDMFHSTFPVETPLCSASALDQIRELKSQGLTGREILASLTESNSTTGLSNNSGTMNRDATTQQIGMSPPNGAPPAHAGMATETDKACQKNHVIKDAIRMSTPRIPPKNTNHSSAAATAVQEQQQPQQQKKLQTRNSSSSINPNLPNRLVGMNTNASPLKALSVGAVGAEFLDNSTDTDVDDADDASDDYDDDDEDGYMERSSNSNKKNNKKSNHHMNNRASRKESREAMIRAHSNSSSSITSESNV